MGCAPRLGSVAARRRSPRSPAWGATVVVTQAAPQEAAPDQPAGATTILPSSRARLAVTMADAELASTAAAPKKAEGVALAGAIFNFIKCALNREPPRCRCMPPGVPPSPRAWRRSACREPPVPPSSPRARARPRLFPHCAHMRHPCVRAQFNRRRWHHRAALRDQVLAVHSLCARSMRAHASGGERRAGNVASVDPLPSRPQCQCPSCLRSEAGIWLGLIMLVACGALTDYS